MVRRELINVSIEEGDLESVLMGILDSGKRRGFVVVMGGRDRRDRGGGISSI